ncbi:hypothetical protein ANN_09260 [Periplaneta americana]|uniref:Uncharacterized protein n=1 Tax=Periplaneta americana TaxID=6978 RepID=A0ABQ8TMX3_PERAM|nr:hypothetical protein ANN_09260 [Periplaneta americana]
MPQRRQLDPVLKGRIIGRLEVGQIQIEVSRALNVVQVSFPGFGDGSKTKEMFVVCLHKISHGSQRRKRTLTARRNQTMPSRQLSSELAVGSGVRVCRQTVYRRLRAGIDPHFIFMDDDARPHRANLVDEYLEGKISSAWTGERCPQI